MPSFAVAGPLFVTLRSVEGATLVVTGGVTLLGVFESNSVPVVDAVFTCTPGVVGVTVIVLVTLPPETIVPRLQVTNCPEAEQPADAETKLTPAGNVSEVTTFVPESGPLFEVTII